MHVGLRLRRRRLERVAPRAAHEIDVVGEDHEFAAGHRRPQAPRGVGHEQPADAEQLTAILESRRYGPQNPGGLFAADQPIELAPSKDAPWQDAVAAFNAITRAGYTRVSFARPR